MARMHSRKHGKHGSKKPMKKSTHWVIYDRDEIEKLILKLSKEGKKHSEIGTILRDQYGVPDVRLFGMKVSKVSGQKKEVPEDMYNLIEKAVILHKPINANKADKTAKHGLIRIESKIRRLGKYYTRTGKLPKDWKYTIEKAKLIVK